MAQTAAGSITRQIGSIYEGSSVIGLNDRQLLERFTARRDAIGEAAFTALVTRHGPLVMHVCRQLIRDPHHAEDAFQIVFMVLARNALSIRDPNLLASWLYGVALRTARKAQIRLTTERHRQAASTMSGPDHRPVVDSTIPSALAAVMASEQSQALHEEIDRLPRTFRSAIVLCYMEGLTVEEAAGRLRRPTGTVRSRMFRAREKLRRALTRRGIIVPTSGLATFLLPPSASASVTSALCEATAHVAVAFAAQEAAARSVSATKWTLAEEVLRSMAVQKLKFAVSTLLALGAIATGRLPEPRPGHE